MDIEESRDQAPDFEVRYRFLAREEGGRHGEAPGQGYRCDWSYEGDDPAQTGTYMIWPEFLAEDGSAYAEGLPVPTYGLAAMRILSPRLRLEIHRDRIREGVRGYFMEGPHRVAEATVIRVVGLPTNGDHAHERR